MKILRFKSCYHLERVKPNMVFLFSENHHHVLKGRIYYQLAPLLKKGIYTEDEMIDQLENKVSAAEIYYALERLKKKGYLHEEALSCNKSMEAFFDLLEVEPQQGLEKLQTCKVCVKSLGKTYKKQLCHLLRSWQIDLVDNLKDADFTVVITNDYLNEEFLVLNEQLEDRPWMLVNPQGKEIWIGPIFDTQKNKYCWKCLAKRIKNNRLEEIFVQTQKKNKRPCSLSIASLKTTESLAFQLAANEIFKWIVLDKTSPLESKIVTFDAISLKMQDHPISFPPCSCKEECKTVLQPIILQSFKKGSHTESGTRCFPLEYTLKKNEHLVSPITGLVSELTALQEFNDSCLHVYNAGHNFAMSNAIKGISVSSLRHSSSGKGKNDLQAKAGGLCEAIERYCGVFQGNEYHIKGSYLDLKETAIHPKDVLHYSENQYKNRKGLNKNVAKMHWVAKRISESKEMAWTPFWSLTHKTFKYLPTSFSYYGYQSSSEAMICLGDSNGNAAGNLLEEAILQGFFELVERDCVAIWWYNRLQRPLVDLDSFQDPYFSAVKEEYKKRGREIWLLDLTNDLQVPTFAAISRNCGESEKIALGFGTHFDASIAALRAVTEMNQLFYFFLRSENHQEEKIFEDSEDRVFNAWMRAATIDNQPYLQGLTDHPLTTSSTYPRIETSDILEDVQRCQKIVEDLGMELLVLDQSRPEANLKVVKVVVPGLRHFWPRFAPGRLYDVPVKMGWLKKPLKESELNPIPVFV